MPQAFLASVRSVAVCLCLLAPAVADAQYTRVSVSSSGAQANGWSGFATVSSTGRYVAFVSSATNLVEGDTNGVDDVFLRDRDTDGDGIFDEAGAVSTRRLNVGPQGVQSDGPSTGAALSGSFVAFRSSATTLVPGLSPAVFRIFVVNIHSGQVDLASVSTTGLAAELDSGPFDITGTDSSYVVAFQSGSRLLAPGDPGFGGAIYAHSSTGRRTVRLSPPLPPGSNGLQPFVASPSVDDAGLFVGFAIVTPGVTRTGRIYRAPPDGSLLEDMGPGTTVELGPHRGPFGVIEWFTNMQVKFVRRNEHKRNAERAVLIDVLQPVTSGDGRHWLFFNSGNALLWDFLADQSTPLPFGGFGDWSDDGRTVVTGSGQTTLVPDDTNGVNDVIAVDLARLLDLDQDGLDDRWEQLSALSSADATGVNGPDGDPDGDGQTNAQEFATSLLPAAQGLMTHPTGTTTRFFAEGVSNGFFDTQLALVNPSPSARAAVQIRYRSSLGSTLVQPLVIPPMQRRTIGPGGEMVDGSFAMDIESSVPVVADRRVTWDLATGYGAHLESSIAAPSTTWYLTEGTTVLGFQLFYLLQNPQATAVEATVRFLRPTGAPTVRTYTLPPHARLTIYVNEVDQALAASDVSAHVVADQPIVVERAMYATRAGQPFALGTASAGVTAPSASWFLAEGATGDFFDTYVLIANPESADAAVTARFLKPDGTVVIRNYTVAANSRYSIFVDAIPGLEATPVSTEIQSTNGVPVVVERAMYWPGGFFDYYEGHSATGVTAPALRWVTAEGEHGRERQAQSYVLIANVGSVPGEARVTLLNEYAPPGLSTVVSLPPTSRATIPYGGGTARSGVLVESIGAAPVPIVVEAATYWTVGGQVWAAGGALVATPLP